MRKKILLALGSITAAATPIVAVVSCGAERVNKLAWTKSDNLVQFDLNANQDKEKGPYNAYVKKDFTDLTENLKKIVDDFEKAIMQGNIDPLKDGDKINVEFMFQYEGTAKKDKDALNTPAAPMEKRSIKFTFEFKKLAKDNIMSKSPLGFKTNFAAGLIKGLLATKLFTTISGAVTYEDISKFFYKPDTGATFKQSELKAETKDNIIKVVEAMDKTGYKTPAVSLTGL